MIEVERAVERGMGMPCWRVSFADGPQAGNEGAVFCFAPTSKQAIEMTRAYLEEQHRWDRCGYDNLEDDLWEHPIPDDAEVRFAD